ncbi:MAG: DUF1553 domain-containing protein [Verrucomicrobia bacterium]|nr:DUF1553 domain-containing protein [Verrucomicrobiota bacterium]
MQIIWKSFAVAAGFATVSARAASADFAKDVFPILQRSCFECHDAKLQKGKLRLDTRELAFKNPEVIVRGDAAKSELYQRIILPKGHDDIMPSRGEPLAKAQIGVIKAWIDAGAVWPDDVKAGKHWAYVKPSRPAVPRSGDIFVADQSSKQKIGGTKGDKNVASPRNAIDAFILARLQREGLKPSPEAERATLIRRVSLDLIGLPPSPAETDAFVNDNDPRAYEKLVDRLLASDQFGVRWARPWLDYARYADSHGFQRDDIRDLWPYRDWVVNALNSDIPFTQFTIEQLAGDLLPNATEAQKIATGFNRSAPTNVEAGTDPEETRVNQIHDRVNTLVMTWLGMTLECAQCHDHKYDPISQRDYYGLFAFFNNTALEADRTNPKTPGSIQFKGPALELTDASTQGERAKLRTQIAAVDAKLAALEKSATAGQPDGEAALGKKAAESPKEYVLEIADFDSTGGATHEILPDKSVLISGEPAPDKDTYVIEVRTKLTDIRGIKLEALADDSLPGKGPGRGDEKRPNFVLNNFVVTAASAGKPEPAKPVKFSSARASFSQGNFPVANLLNTDNDARGGWAINPKFHESHWAVLETAEPLGFADGTVLRFKLEQDFGGGRTIGRVRLSAITGNVGGQALPAELAEALARPADKRTAKQKKALADYRLKQNPEFARLEKQKTQLEAQLRKFKAPTTLVMQEDTPRMSTIFMRGEFRTPGDKVEPHTPAVLHPLKPVAADVRRLTSNSELGTRNAEQNQSLLTSSPTRLDLAQWLVSRENPLVARVVVNRWWAELFGHGLVTTPEDFGIKGETPTHPELLDWLAVEFMDNGWSMKKLLKTIVMSATYRQSSRVTPELFARDDQNLFYARGPRHRLDAESIRDNALAIAGLLSLKRGGEPVKPYQPDGLWVKVGGQRYDYDVSPGEEKYRRGIYVVWKRGAPYPSFVNFDANARLACRVKRPRSNTPLQALTLMNDPVYVEAAMAFAKRVLTEKPAANTDERITHAFRLATGRVPRADELATLSNLLSTERTARTTDAKGAKEFVGKFALPPGMSAEEFAAWYAIAAALLNLDETISKG